MQNNIYSVSQVNKYIKNMFLQDYLLNSVSVRGEVSNLKYHSSGHIYFTLKDEKGAIKCVMFSSMRQGLSFMLKEGMQIVVSGSVEVYERDGNYQIYARSIKQDGIGNLFEEFEKLKEKLKDAGMFEEEYKRPIPKFVKTLGVVTAPTGAAVRDIINVSKRRNPGIQIILFPAIVQGDEAPDSICKGIKALEEYGVDCIICGRGGGSIEDLWGFNSEKVAETIFNCSVPIISAVGHETDFTIADFVADLRAATPSAAAELAVCDVYATTLELRKIKERYNRDIKSIINNERNKVLRLSEKLSLLSPKAKLKSQIDKLSKYKDSLNALMEGKLKDYHYKMALLSGKLHGLSPLVKLSSGYSFVSNKGKTVKSIGDVKKDDCLKINVTDGVIYTVVKDTEASD